MRGCPSKSFAVRSIRSGSQVRFAPTRCAVQSVQTSPRSVPNFAILHSGATRTGQDRFRTRGRTTEPQWPPSRSWKPMTSGLKVSNRCQSFAQSRPTSSPSCSQQRGGLAHLALSSCRVLGKAAEQVWAHKPHCGLTLRSSGPPPAGHATLAIHFPLRAPSRFRPLSSNVRPRSAPLK
jgi:hypothetical protein